MTKKELIKAFETILDICYDEGNEELDKEIIIIQEKIKDPNSETNLKKAIEEIIDIIPIYCEDFDKTKYNEIKEIFIEAYEI